MESTYKYTLAKAIEDLEGDPPSDRELKRLVENYPSYKLPHRSPIIDALANGGSVQEILTYKLAAKGILTLYSKQSKGGHVRWVTLKLQKAVIRLWYLRYRVDHLKTRRQANQILVQKFGSQKSEINDPQSKIRKKQPRGA